MWGHGFVSPTRLSLAWHTTDLQKKVICKLAFLSSFSGIFQQSKLFNGMRELKWSLLRSCLGYKRRNRRFCWPRILQVLKEISLLKRNCLIYFVRCQDSLRYVRHASNSFADCKFSQGWVRSDCTAHFLRNNSMTNVLFISTKNIVRTMILYFSCTLWGVLKLLGVVSEDRCKVSWEILLKLDSFLISTKTSAKLFKLCGTICSIFDFNDDNCNCKK